MSFPRKRNPLSILATDATSLRVGPKTLGPRLRGDDMVWEEAIPGTLSSPSFPMSFPRRRGIQRLPDESTQVFLSCRNLNNLPRNPLANARPAWNVATVAPVAGASTVRGAGHRLLRTAGQCLASNRAASLSGFAFSCMCLSRSSPFSFTNQDKIPAPDYLKRD